jgi:hypothetical protein
MIGLRILKRRLLFGLVSAFALAGPVQAASDCEAKAVGKDGKPLSGAAKASSVNKCRSESK